MNQPSSPLTVTPSVDAVLDRFLERLDQVRDEAGIAALIEELSASHPERAAEFRRLADGLRQLRDLRDPERLGPYRIRGVIAVGGMGKIYEAEEDDLGRIVAIKTIKPGRTTLEQLLARFDRERKALARLHHSHLVPIFATGQQDGLLYFAMPRIRGTSLRGLIRAASGVSCNGTAHLPIASFEDLVQEASTAEASDHASQITDHPQTDPDPVPDRPPPPHERRPEIPEYREKVVRLMTEVAEAVHHAHLASVIHRDLKPSNILVEHSSVENTCHSWVLDFGLALFKTPHAETAAPGPVGIGSAMADPVTQGLLGTPIYMAPEQIDPSEDRPIDARTDVHALGSTLYELLTLRPAVDLREPITDPRERLKRIRHQILHELPEPLGRVVPGFPRELEAVCLKALEKRPENRYASAQELAHDLRRWLQGKPTKAGKAGPVTRLAMLVNRRRATSAAVAVVALSIVGAMTGSVYVSRLTANHALAEAKASKAETAHTNAQLAFARKHEQALQREKDLVALQRLRTAYHFNGWFDEVWTKIRALRGQVFDPDLQAQAAASLEGIDAKFRKSFPREFRQVAFDPRARRLLMHHDGSNAGPRRAPLTALWDGATDTFVLEKDLGPGVIAFRDDGTPLQLSQSREDPAALTLFDLATSRPLQHFRSPRQGIAAITAWTLSRSGNYIAAVARPARGEAGGKGVPEAGATLPVWDAGSGKLICALEHKAAVNLVLSPDGRLLATRDENGEVTVWLLPEGRPLTRFHVSRAQIGCMAFGRDPVWHDSPALDLPRWLLAVGDWGGLITVWDLAANRPRSICRGSTYEIHSLDFSPDGALLASAGRHHARLWDVATGNNLLMIQGEGYQFLYAIAFAPDGRSLAVANGAEFNNKPNVGIVDIEQGRGIRTLYGLQGRVDRVVVSPNGRLIAAVSNDWQVGIWDWPSGQLRAVLEAPVGYFVDSTASSFDAEGRRFACSAGHQAKIWDLDRHRLLAQWALSEGLDGGLAFRGEGRLLLLRTETRSGKNPPFGHVKPTDDPRVIRLYDLLGPNPTKAVKEITDFDWHVDSIAVTPDASYYVVDGSGTVEGRPKRLVNVFQGPGGKLLDSVSSRLPANSGTCATVFDPTGKVISLVLDPDNRATVLEVPSLRTLTTIVEPGFQCLGPGATRWCARRTLSSGQPTMALVDERHPEQPYVQILLERQGQFSRFTPDGQSVVWCNQDGTVSVCDLTLVNRRLTELGMGW
jgi:serine/threonine protein kinase/WD40 repeat protein